MIWGKSRMHHNNLCFTSLLFLTLCGMLTVTGAFADEVTVEYVPGELIVWFDTNAGLSAQAMEQMYSAAHVQIGAKQLKTLSALGYPQIQLVQIPAESSVEQTAQDYLSIAGVKYAEPNYIVKVQKTPNDPRYPDLWGMDFIDAPIAWEYTTGSKQVLVAVVDTGVDYNHPDLAANMWTNPGEIPGNGIDDDGNGFIDDYYGWNFADNNADPMDRNGHGTHVAGTIGAVGNNGIGVAGVNWDVSIMAVKGLGDDGRGSTFALISGVIYASNMGADIINNSWGGGSPSRALTEAVRLSPALIVFAAGNDGTNLDIEPESTNIDRPNVILVAASNVDGDPAWYTNYGKTTVHVTAPGGETSDEKDPNGILSTTPNNTYSFYQGTSMAAPMVSGLAALIKAANPSLTAPEIKNIIIETVTPAPQWSELTITGGIVNAANAIAKTIPPALITSEDGVGYVWSEDKTLLTITESGSYAFANSEFGPFGMFIDAPLVSLDGRKWQTNEQIMITGYRFVVDDENVLIGIHGKTDYMETLNLEHVNVTLHALDEDFYISGIYVARNIFDSSISIRGTNGNLIDGVGTLHGFFKNSKISILAGDESVSTGVRYLYGTIVGGDITISTPRLAQDFIITGVEYVDETGVISGGFITLTGVGSGIAHGVSNLMGTVTGGLFTIHSDEVYGVSEIAGGSISDGGFKLHGYSDAIGIGEMHSNAMLSGGLFEITSNNFAIGIEFMDESTVSDGVFIVHGDLATTGISEMRSNAVLSGGTFFASSNNWAAGIEFVQDKSTVSGSEFHIFAKESVGIMLLTENSVVKASSFNVQGTNVAIGLFLLSGTSVMDTNAEFRVRALNPDGRATGIWYCMDGVISDGELRAESNGHAFSIIDNQCTITNGKLWAVSPLGGRAVGIYETTVLPLGGEINAWANIRELAFGIASPQLSNGKEIQNYGFDYDGEKFVGTATEYSIRSAMVREIYDTDKEIIIDAHPDMEALIIPDLSATSSETFGDPHVFSFSRPGYDRESILQRLEN